MRQRELIGDGRRGPALEGGGDLGPANGRDYPNQGQHHDRLDHCEAATPDHQHCAAVPRLSASRGPTDSSAVLCPIGEHVLICSFEEIGLRRLLLSYHKRLFPHSKTSHVSLDKQKPEAKASGFPTQGAGLALYGPTTMIWFWVSCPVVIVSPPGRRACLNPEAAGGVGRSRLMPGKSMAVVKATFA